MLLKCRVQAALWYGCFLLIRHDRKARPTSYQLVSSPFSPRFITPPVSAVNKTTNVTHSPLPTQPQKHLPTAGAIDSILRSATMSPFPHTPRPRCKQLNPLLAPPPQSPTPPPTRLQLKQTRITLRQVSKLPYWRRPSLLVIQQIIKAARFEKPIDCQHPVTQCRQTDKLSAAHVTNSLIPPQSNKQTYRARGSLY
jgi:hypothetical protein